MLTMKILEKLELRSNRKNASMGSWNFAGVNTHQQVCLKLCLK